MWKQDWSNIIQTIYTVWNFNVKLQSEKFSALNFQVTTSMQNFNLKSSVHWTFKSKLQWETSMHWTFTSKLQCTLNFHIKTSVYIELSHQNFNALNFEVKTSMHWTFDIEVLTWKFNALNFSDWSFQNKAITPFLLQRLWVTEWLVQPLLPERLSGWSGAATQPLSHLEWLSGCSSHSGRRLSGRMFQWVVNS